MLTKYQKDPSDIKREILDQKIKVKKIGFKFTFFFYLSQMDIYVISLNREKSGLFIDLNRVYVLPLIPEISPF